MIAMPDPSTFAVLPWRPEEQGVGRMFCDVLTPEREPYEGDPRHVLRRALEREGYDVLATTRGKEARRLLNERIFDVLVVDNLMPDLSGLDLVRDVLPVFREVAIAGPHHLHMSAALSEVVVEIREFLAAFRS